LKEVKVPLVKQRYGNVSSAEGLGGIQPAKSSADDDDAVCHTPFYRVIGVD